MMKLCQCITFTLQRIIIVIMESKSMGSNQMDHKRKQSGFIDRFVEKLPEIHLRGYHYCGPNTDLTLHKPCINELDCLCKDHDIAYGESKDIEWRYAADKLLLLRAFKRVYANESRIGERIAALFVSVLISIKIFLDRSDLYIKNAVRYLVVKLKKLLKINAPQHE